MLAPTDSPWPGVQVLSRWCGDTLQRAVEEAFPRQQRRHPPRGGPSDTFSSPPRGGAQRPRLSGFALCTQVGAVSARFHLPSCGAELLTVTSLWK